MLPAGTVWLCDVAFGGTTLTNPQIVHSEEELAARMDQ
jgi:hypothetical protein